VAHRLNLTTAVTIELPADELVVALDELAPPAVPELGGAAGRVDDVGEHDGRQHPVRLALRARTGEELHDLVENLVGVDKECVVRARQLDELRFRDQSRERAAPRKRRDTVVRSMKD